MVGKTDNLFGLKYKLCYISAVLVTVFLLMTTFSRLSLDGYKQSNFAQIFVYFCLAFSVGVCFYKKIKNTLDVNTILILALVCGFAIKLAYCINVPFYQNQHDVEGLGSNGHLSYIYKLAIGDGLPETNNWQYSHPPLHHYLSSLVVRFSWAIGLDNNAAFENIQYLTLLYSALLSVVGIEILKQIGIKGRTLCVTSVFVCLHPFLTILSGSINNDTLSILFTMSAFLYLIKWYNTPLLKYAMISGLFAGLGMMTKFSVALIVVISAIVVLIKFIKCSELKIGTALGQTSCYLAAALPLGLWYQIRGYVLFDQPFGYVAQISKESQLYIGDISIFKRLILPFSTEFHGVYADVWEEHNLWQYLSRNSIFGEYSFNNEGLAVLLVAFNIVLILAAVFALVYIVIKRFKGFSKLVPILVLIFVQMAFFVYFNIRYPFGCSMDFRYIVPVLFGAAALYGTVSQNLSLTDGKCLKIISSSFELIIAMFSLFSILIFL